MYEAFLDCRMQLEILLPSDLKTFLHLMEQPTSGTLAAIVAPLTSTIWKVGQGFTQQETGGCRPNCCCCCGAAEVWEVGSSPASKIETETRSWQEYFLEEASLSERNALSSLLRR
jgi:hypothetical protein